jgi:epoxide hydrolase 4
LSLRLTEDLDRYVADLRLERLTGVSHWIQNDAVEEVNGHLLRFLTA